MSISSKIKLGIVVALALASFHALGGTITPQIGGGIGLGFDGGISGNGKPVVQPNGDILLVDGVSFILQTDAASLVCRAGGC